MKKPQSHLTCDLCDKKESLDIELCDVIQKHGWFLNRKLTWNDHYSILLDVCMECFDKSFEKPKEQESKKQSRQFLKKGFPSIFGWLK